MLDDEERSRIRQELLEAVTSGIGGPALAPMPGVMLELFEIAAMKRRHAKALKEELMASDGQALTAHQNGSRMAAKLVRAFRAIAGVAQRVGSGPGNRQLPA